jgi:hypothetical protein
MVIKKRLFCQKYVSAQNNLLCDWRGGNFVTAPKGKSERTILRREA